MNDKDTFFTHMCTGRKAAASEHETQNLAITSLMHYHYTNFVCNNPLFMVAFS